MKSRVWQVVAAAGLAIAGSVSAAEPTQQELLEKIQKLEQEVQQLKLQSQEPRKPDPSVVDATVDELMKDAQRRSQWLQTESSSFLAGWKDGKFLIQSEDGNFVLNPNAQFQFRYVANYADAVDGDSETVDGFEIRRMKFGLAGNVFTKKLKYDIVWATDRDGGELLLEDAFVTYQVAENWFLRGGQFKDFIYHEENTSSKRQLAVDRSLVNELIGGGVTDRVQGVALIYEKEPIVATAAFHDGINTDNTNFTNGGGSSLFDLSDPNFGVSGRIEYFAMGNEKAYADFSAAGNTENLLVFGGGADLTESGDVNVLFHTADAQWENASGLGAYVAYLGAFSDGDGGNFYDFGAVVQVGYMLGRKWELFGRGGWTRLDDARPEAAITEDIYELTAGVSYYMYKHSAKFTLDVTWLPNGSPVGVSGLGIVEQSADEDQIVFRAQFQLLL